MKKVTGFFGILGLVLFLFGLTGALVLGDAFGLPLLAAHMLLGVGLIIAWLVTSGAKSLGSAGDVVMGRTARFSVSAFFYIVVFLAVLVGINYVGYKNSHRFDTTDEQIYSLSQQSKQVVTTLQKPLKFVSFKGVNPELDDMEVQRVLGLYRYENSAKVKVEQVDPRTQPHLVDTYGMQPGDVLYIQLGEDGDSGKVASRVNKFSEDSITNAVLKLTRGAARKVYVVQGHGEPGITDTSGRGAKALVGALANENLNVEGIFLAEKGSVPEDAAALIVIAPEKSIPQTEQDIIARYVEGGGRALLLGDVQRPDVSTIAARFGITIGNDIVVDLVQRLFGPAALGAQVVARDYGMSPVTRSFGENTVTIFNIASSVKGGAASEGTTYTELVKSGPNAWAERDLAAIFNAETPSATFDDASDTKGPVAVAVSYEKKLTNSEQQQGDQKFEKVARLAVFGDSDWVLNESLGSYGNRDLLLNTVSWLTGEEGGVTIRPKNMKESVAPITRDQFLFILTSSLVVPELILIAGLFVWWRRKQTV